jgi:hypothetical protein
VLGAIVFHQQLYKGGALLESKQAFVVRVTPQGDLAGAAAYVYPFCPKNYTNISVTLGFHTG